LQGFADKIQREAGVEKSSIGGESREGAIIGSGGCPNVGVVELADLMSKNKRLGAEIKSVKGRFESIRLELIDNDVLMAGFGVAIEDYQSQARTLKHACDERSRALLGAREDKNKALMRTHRAEKAYEDIQFSIRDAENSHREEVLRLRKDLSEARKSVERR
jgi:hypothetical protein